MELDEMRRLKRERGYSIKQISEYSGVPEGTVRKVFSGESARPRAATMIALERVFRGDESLYQGKNYIYDMNSIAPEHRKYLDEAGSAPPRIEETVFTYGTKKLMTVKDLEGLPEECRCELIDGVIYDMGEPSLTHQELITEMLFQIESYIRKKQKKCKVITSPVGVRILKDDYNLVQPDVLITCREKTALGHRIDGAPPFIMEIVSKWSVKRDYVVKYNKYVAGGVEEYWILDPLRRMLTIYDQEKEYVPEIVPLEGKRGIRLFGGELEIDLEELAAIIEEDETLRTPQESGSE